MNHPNRPITQVARDVLSLFKLRIGWMIMITALVGMAVTPGPALGWDKVLVLALSVLLSSASAGAFNQYHEYQSDRLLILIVLLLIGAVTAAAWWLNPLSATFVFLGAFFYAVVYTVWLKQRSWLNIVVGGLAGSFAVLAGAAAVDPAMGPLPFILAAVLFLWTPPHFWSLAIANEAQYKAAGIPMLPVVVGTQRAAHIVLRSTVALGITALLPVFWGAGVVYFIAAVLGGCVFVYKAHQLAQEPSRKTAMGAFFASLVQLSLLLIGATIDSLLR
jgi:protoheme IX farnesyltransferase